MWTEWESIDPRGGFDAVIGNPPSCAAEQIRAIKPALRGLYADSFDGVAKPVWYFYARGLGLLRKGGRLSFVVTNKWLKAGYAEKLRSVLGREAWVEAVIDFGHAKGFFPDADVMPSVLVARRPDPRWSRRRISEVAVISCATRWRWGSLGRKCGQRRSACRGRSWRRGRGCWSRLR